jgi:hypothetical protein
MSVLFPYPTRRDLPASSAFLTCSRSWLNSRNCAMRSAISAMRCSSVLIKTPQNPKTSPGVGTGPPKIIYKPRRTSVI